MHIRPLPRSYKRKYKKIHAGFSRAQYKAEDLKADLDAAVATALKLTADTDYLLQLLCDLVPSKQPQDVKDQLAREDLKDDETILDDDGSELADDYYSEDDTPIHFESLPWNLDLDSFSGSHLEDLERAVNTVPVPAVPEVKQTPNSSKKARSNGPTKKRERAEEETPSGKKKKRKSMLAEEVDY